MKIKFTVIDDEGKEHSGEVELSSGKSVKKVGKTTPKSEKTDDPGKLYPRYSGQTAGHPVV